MISHPTPTEEDHTIMDAETKTGTRRKPTARKPKPDAVDRAVAGVDRAIARLIALLDDPDPRIVGRAREGLERFGIGSLIGLARAVGRARLRGADVTWCRLLRALDVLSSTSDLRGGALEVLTSALFSGTTAPVFERLLRSREGPGPVPEEVAWVLGCIPPGWRRPESAEDR
jgi:hypothetical protein